ncbi:HD-GYP domain-containing protein [Rubrobacter indicoceani]|uniref:HD-GYP domain-containing protein n=1 Tax=Rubrobacter indicoceani TaxID=2051957 RepID=UPI000E5C476D|nr:HD-GYP domain-containing protein [Rubrobacter indicoceani]
MDAPGKALLGGSETKEVRFSEIVSAFSFVLDMVEGQPEGHSVRTCYIGMMLGARLGLGEEDLSALFYALLIKDVGCSSNASKISTLFGAEDFGVKRAFKLTDWSRLHETVLYAARNVRPDGTAWSRLKQFVTASKGGPKTTGELIQIRCDRGAEIARFMGFSEKTALAIRNLDEHHDGSGYPDGKRGDEIPLLARICGFAQTLEVFYTNYGTETAERMARARRRKWFDPGVVDAFLKDPGAVWKQLTHPELERFVYSLEPQENTVKVTPRLIDLTAISFSRVIDAKSPFTYEHSAGVARMAVELGERLGFTKTENRNLWRAALLHDIGKLGISNTILDKPAPLTREELAKVREHPRLTYESLKRVPLLEDLALVAASHHEKLDGSGYHRGVTGEYLGPAARILTVADIYDALAQARPYRKAMPREKIISILRSDVRAGRLCPQTVEVLEDVIREDPLCTEGLTGGDPEW